MKILIMALLFTGVASPAWAVELEELETPTLVCAGWVYYQKGAGCVSKASIEKDKLQIQVLKLQLQEFKDKAAAKENEKSKQEELEKEKVLKKLSPKERKQLGFSK